MDLNPAYSQFRLPHSNFLLARYTSSEAKSYNGSKFQLTVCIHCGIGTTVTVDHELDQCLVFQKDGEKVQEHKATRSRTWVLFSKTQTGLIVNKKRVPRKEKFGHGVTVSSRSR